MSSRIRFGAAVLAVLAAAALVYADTFPNRFVYDDLVTVEENLFIRDWGNLGLFFSPDYYLLSEEYSFRPLVTLTYFIDYHFWGLNPWGYHLSNLLWHLAATAVLALIVRSLWPRRPALLVGALFFAVHPVQVEAVAGISFREDLLCACFYFLALLGFLRAENRRGTAAAVLKSAALLAFAAGLFSKEMAVTFPLVLTAMRLLLAPPGNRGRRVFSDPWLWASFLIAAAYGVARFSLFYQRGTLPSTPEFGDLPTRVLLVGKSLALYGTRLLFPVNLTVEYPDPNRAAAWGRYLLAGIPLAAAAGLGAWRTGGNKARFGLAWLGLALLPICNLFPSPRLGAERFLYLPLGGFCVWAAATLEAAARAVAGTGRKVLAAAVAVVVLALAAGTVSRTGAWRNNLTLFEAAVRTAPDSSKARHGLGNEYFRRGRLREAVDEFRRAIAILPREPFYYNSLGVAYGEAGDLARAREQFEISRRLNPGDPLILINLAVLELKAGRPEQAEQTIRQYTRARPRDPHGFLILGEAALVGGKWETARGAYRAALDLDPGAAGAWNGLAYCFYREGRPEEAERAWRRAAALDPANPDVRRALDILRHR